MYGCGPRGRGPRGTMRFGAMHPRPRNPFPFYNMPPDQRPRGPPFGVAPRPLGEPPRPRGPPGFQGRPPHPQGQHFPGPPSHRQHFRGHGAVPHRGRGNGPGGRGFKRQGSGQQPFPAKKRKKEMKESEANFYCDTCDRGFKLEEKYQEHRNSHVQCPKDGCSYIAAKKLVDLHIKTQHRTGHAKRIWQLESEQDIKKWIEERKKKFPTTENIAKKKEQQHQKFQRGEVLENKEFGKMRGGRGRHHTNRRNMRRHRPGDNKGQAPAVKEINNKNDFATDLSNRIQRDKSQATDPMAMLLKSDDVNDEGSEEETGTPTGSLALAGGLGSLACAYGSDMSDSDHADDQTPVHGAGDQTPVHGAGDQTPVHGAGNPTPANSDAKTNTTSKGGSVQVSNKQEPKRQCENSTKDMSLDRDRQSHRGRQRNDRRKGGQKHAKPVDRKLTLLQKLLAPDIRHERNVILQCVRYIVKNNFFDVENQTSVPVKNISTSDNDSVIKHGSNLNSSGSYVEESDIWEN